MDETWFDKCNIVIKEEVIISDEEEIEDDFVEQNRKEPREIFTNRDRCNPCLVEIHDGVDPIEISSCAKCNILRKKTEKSKITNRCKRCYNKFSISRDLEHHTCPTYTCDLCGKMFNMKWKLIPHIRQDHAKERHQCPQCKNLFLSKYSLARHYRTHTGEKPYKCHKCQKSFTQSGILNRHIKTHTEEKPYRCSFCSEKFTRSYSVKRHYLKHLGIKPYECNKCGKTFTRDFTLSKHRCIK